MGNPIDFPDGGRALVVEAAPDASPRRLLDELGIQAPGAIVVVVGAADSLDPSIVPWLTQQFSRGLGVAATKTDAVLIDGGTASGAMAVLGEAIADRLPRPALLGVAPLAKVTYPDGPPADGERVALEPNHTHFVLADLGEWGQETELLFRLADTLADGVPVVVVLVGGGQVAREEARQAARRDWPLLVITGTGGLADNLAEIMARRQASAKVEAIEDPVMAEIVAYGKIDTVALRADPSELGGLILRRLRPDEPLELVWQQFADLDVNACRQQIEFRRMQLLILCLGVVGTLLAVTQGTIEAEGVLGNHWLRDVLRYAIILVPITLAGLLTAAARFGSGNKWLVLRGSAEAVKREIFRYRARAVVYSETGHTRTPRQVRLSERVGTIAGGVMKTDVNRAGLHPYVGPLPPRSSVAEGDDGFSLLTPEQYLEVRVLHQAKWYQRKVILVERKHRLLRWAVIAFGALGTLLAAIGFELWIAVTTAVIGAVTTYLEYTQVENTLLHYNQAATDLETIRRWWISLPADAKLKQANVNKLVDQAEGIMQSESTGWLQEMQDAMADLRRVQERTEAREAQGEWPEPDRKPAPGHQPAGATGHGRNPSTSSAPAAEPATTPSGRPSPRRGGDPPR